MTKKVVSLFLALVMILCCLSACGSVKLTVEKVQNAGKLVIGTSPDFPPFESLSADGKVEGIEIEIMELICQELGVELEIKQMDFDSVLPGVQTGKFNVGVSGISVTPEREKNTLFTVPYCLAAQAIVVTSDSTIASTSRREISFFICFILSFCFKRQNENLHFWNKHIIHITNRIRKCFCQIFKKEGFSVFRFCNRIRKK